MTEKRRRPNAITEQMILAQRFFSLYLCFCLLFSKEEEAYGESLRVQDPHSIHNIFSMSSSVDKSIRNLTEECETRLKHGCSVKKELWFIRDKFLIFQRIHSKSCPCRIFWQYSEVLLNICEVKSLSVREVFIDTRAIICLVLQFLFKRGISLSKQVLSLWTKCEKRRSKLNLQTFLLKRTPLDEFFKNTEARTHMN